MADNMEIVLPEHDEDTMRAVQYLVLQDRDATIQEIADFFGVKSRSTIYGWVQRWEQNGSLDKARKIYMIPKHEKIAAAMSQAADHYPGLIMGAVKIAETSKSEQNRLMATEWVRQHVIQPMLDKRQDVGAEELNYAANAVDFNPTVVKAPKFLKKE